MRTNKIKPAKKDKRTRIICGTPGNMREACNELDHEKNDMHVVWTYAGFWALPRK